MASHKYKSAVKLSGHSSSVSVLTFSPNGEHLASGSDDGTILITATRSWKVVKKLVNISPVTALMWDPTFPMMILCGFASGAVLTVHIGDNDQEGSEQQVWTDTFGGPIHCVASDNLGRTLAIGHGDEVTLLDQKAISYWENIRVLPDPPEFTSDLPTPSPRMLHFTKDGQLIASYLDHGLTCWDIIAMNIEWHIVPRSCSIGWSAVSPDEKYIVVSNLYDGLDFYSISDRALCYSVPCPINQNKNKPVPVLFSEDGKVVVVGGTSGNVRVLDSASCETLETLLHDGDLIQAIDFCINPDGTRTIAAGVSELGPGTTIQVWVSDPMSKPKLRASVLKPLGRDQPAEPPSHRRLIFGVLIGLLSVCCIFVITSNDAWTHQRGPLLRYIKPGAL